MNKFEDNKHFTKTKDDKLAFTSDREYCAKVSVDRTAFRYRRDLEMQGKHISHAKAEQWAQRLAEKRDRER